MWEDIVVGVLTHFASVHRACPEGGPVSEGRSNLFREKKLSSMTLTLIATSVAFLLLASPVCVYMTLERGETAHVDDFWSQILYQIKSISKHAIKKR